MTKKGRKGKGQPDEKALTKPTEERDVSALAGVTGEGGRPVTIHESYLEPGRPEFDAQSQFLKIYEAHGENGPGETEDFYDAYAWVECGEVARKSAELDYNARGSYHTVMARDIADNLTHGADVNAMRASLRKQYVEPGLVVDWAIVCAKVVDMLAGNSVGLDVTDDRTYEHNILEEALYHMEQEAQNNFHGWEGPLPYEKVHIVPEKRDGDVPTSYCGQQMRDSQSDGPSMENGPARESKQPLWITRARFDRFGMPPFCPSCLECCEVMAHAPADAAISPDALVKAQVEGKCICAQMRKIVRMSTFDPPDKRGPGDPMPGWDCPEHGLQVDALSEAQSRYTASHAHYLERRAWFKNVALVNPFAPLDEADAEEWAAKMTSAELVLTYPREPEGLRIEYNDFLGIATAEDTRTGRFATLESETIDTWAKSVQGEDRARIIKALVMDKFLHNPDVEGRLPANTNVLLAAQEPSVFGEYTQLDELERIRYMQLDEVERVKLARLRIEQALIANGIEGRQVGGYEAHWSESGDALVIIVEPVVEADEGPNQRWGYLLALVNGQDAEVVEEWGYYIPPEGLRTAPLSQASAANVLALSLQHGIPKRPLSAEERKRIEDFAEAVNTRSGPQEDKQQYLERELREDE